MRRVIALLGTCCVLLATAAAPAQAKTSVGCANAGFTRAVAKVKPSSCTLLALRGTGLRLTGLKWSSWGGKTAKGKGKEGTNGISVTLYRRVRVKGGLCYTRAKYSAKYGSGRLAFATCGTRTG